VRDGETGRGREGGRVSEIKLGNCPLVGIQITPLPPPSLSRARLFVGNLPFEVTNKELTEYYNKV
jgi:RNA recognition motif-containing protein